MGSVSPVELRAFGAFELLVDGHVVTLGSAKLRVLLAALAVDAGEVVPEGRLIDVLWEERPPPSALATLQKYVYRLRGVLDSCASTLRVETCPSGYSLVLDGAVLDADRFSVLVAEARRVVGEDRDDALRLFDEALALWRGPPWYEFADRDLFRVDATRLVELRIVALEERVDIAVCLRAPP